MKFKIKYINVTMSCSMNLANLKFFFVDQFRLL